MNIELMVSQRKVENWATKDLGLARRVDFSQPYRFEAALRTFLERNGSSTNYLAHFTPEYRLFGRSIAIIEMIGEGEGFAKACALMEQFSN
jgi:hypothetical protein